MEPVSFILRCTSLHGKAKRRAVSPHTRVCGDTALRFALPHREASIPICPAGLETLYLRALDAGMKPMALNSISIWDIASVLISVSIAIGLVP